MPPRLKDQRTEKVKSLAEKIFPNLQPKPKAPIDGWAKQRSDWGEVDHRARAATSPLGGQAKK
jgi:hypothetical protein